MSHATSVASHRPPAKAKGGFVFNLCAAAASSSLHTSIAYPLHRVKSLLQTQDALPAVSSGRIARFTFANAFSRIVKEQGVLSLWRGNLPYTLRHVPSTSLSFSLKDLLHDVLPKADKATQPMQHLMWNLVAGGLAGSIALAVVYPLDFTSIRMAANLHDKSPGMMEELRHSARRGGLAAWYRGFGTSVVAIGAYKALYFGLYDTAKAYMKPKQARRSRDEAAGEGGEATSQQQQHKHQHKPQQPAPPQQAASAAVVGSPGPEGAPGLFSRWVVASVVVWVASTVTYPLDVIRKRLVVDTLLPSERRQYPGGFWDCVATTAKKEGFRGFYRSYGVDITLRLGGGLLLVIYDEVKRFAPG